MPKHMRLKNCIQTWMPAVSVGAMVIVMICLDQCKYIRMEVLND